ncbi:transglycosylase domain-containing protein [Rhodococcus sp. NPDC054953]
MNIRLGDSRNRQPRPPHPPEQPPQRVPRWLRPGSPLGDRLAGLLPPTDPAGPTTPTPPWPPAGAPTPPGPIPGPYPWPAPPPASAPTWPRVAVRWGARLLAAFLVFCVVTPIVYRVVTPPRTLFMLTDEANGPTVQQTVSLDYISRHYVAATLVHEDAQLGTRTGPYHLGEFVDRTTTYLTTGEDNSGSTIPQQLVKNIFLIRGEWLVAKVARKGVEAVLAWPFNMMGDRRQLELYLNYAQFGPNLYGICAASWYYFNRAPWEGNTWDAATLAGLLPLGEDAKRSPGGGVDITSDGQWVVASTVTRARDRVPQRIAEMGGWEGTVETVGILDSAADNDPLGDPDSCSTMPESVAERLAAEDAWWSPQYGG